MPQTFLKGNYVASSLYCGKANRGTNEEQYGAAWPSVLCSMPAVASMFLYHDVRYYGVTNAIQNDFNVALLLLIDFIPER